MQTLGGLRGLEGLQHRHHRRRDRHGAPRPRRLVDSLRAAARVLRGPRIDETVARKCPQFAEADREARRAEQNAMVIRADAQRLRAGIQSGTKVRPAALVDPSKCAHNQ